MGDTVADQVGRRCRITECLRPEILLDAQESLQANRLQVRELKTAYGFANTTLLTTELPFSKSRRQAGTHEELTMHQQLNEDAVSNVK